MGKTKERRRNFKHNVCILAFVIIQLLVSTWLVFAEPGSEYNKSRKITIDLNGGSLDSSKMKWMYRYDRSPKKGANAGASTTTWYEGVATGWVVDKHGNDHYLGAGRGEKYQGRQYPFPDNENPKAGTFTQHMDFVGQTPWIWLGNPTRTGYKFDGWTVSPSRPSGPVSYNQGTLIHAGYSGGDFTITAKWKDNTPPTVKANPESRAWGNTNASTKITISDGQSGIRDVWTIVDQKSSFPSDSDSRWSNKGKVSSINQTFSTEGNNYIHVWARDNEGNVTRKTFGPFRVDKTAPSVSGDPSNSSWGSSNVTTTISISDSLSGIQGVWTITDTSSSFPADSDSRWKSHGAVASIKHTFSSEGSHYIHVWARDNASNVTRKTIGPFRIDKTAPNHVSHSMTGADYVNGNDHWVKPGTLVKYKGRGYDALSGLKTTFLRIYNSNTDARARHQWSGTANNCDYWWTNEKVEIVSANRTYNSGGYGELEWGIKMNNYEEDFNVQYYYRDNANNDTPSYTNTGIRIRVDSSPPTITANLANRDWSNNNVSVSLTYSDSRSGVKTRQYAWSESTSTPSSWSSYTSAVSQSNEGVWYLHVKGTDNVGNQKTQYFGPYRIDKTGPTITATPESSEWNNDSVSVTLNFSDDHSGIATRQYAWSTSTTTPTSWNNYTGPVTQSSEGVWYLHARAVDVAGNVTTRYFGPYKIDKTNPTVIASIDSGGWYNSDVIVSLSFTDNLSGVSTRQYAWSQSTARPSSWNAYTGPVTLSSEGIWYFLHVRAVDNAGNEAFYCFGPYHVDKSGPRISATPASRGWDNSDVTVKLDFTDQYSGVISCQYAWSTSTTTPTSWNNYTGPVTQSGNGTWYLHARAIDAVGNITTQYFGPYRIDKAEPTITASPSSRSWGNTEVSVTLNFNDSLSGIATRQYTWSTSTTTPTSWNNYTGPVTQSSEGVWYLHARAVDNAGNEVTRYFGPYRIDKTAPTISATPASRGWDNTEVVVTLNFSDSASGVDTPQYAWSTSTATPSSWTDYTEAVRQSSEGTWYLHARATDKAGNVVTQYFGPYRIDKTAPNHVSHSITGYRFKNGNDYWIRANDTVKYKMRGYDQLSQIRYSYARLLGTGVDARAQHDWNADANHLNYFQTSEQIVFIDVARTYNNSGYREVEWTIKAKDFENDLAVQYYYRDNATNTIGYNNTGMRLRIDTTKPIVSVSSESGDMIPSDEITITATDSRSGLKTIKYKWSTSTNTPTSWIDASEKIENNVAVVRTNPPHPGERMYLHYYAEDQVGNVTVGYAGHYNVVDDTVSIDGLALVRVVNPPLKTSVPVIYPVNEPPAINAGYRVDFITTVTGADEVEIRLYDKGKIVPIYTAAGETTKLNLLVPSHAQNNVRFSFWLDQEMKEGTVLDMEIILKRSLPGNRRYVVGNTSLGRNALLITGSSKKDWRINLIR